VAESYEWKGKEGKFMGNYDGRSLSSFVITDNNEKQQNDVST
jgi:hypothetical protein